MGKYDHLSDAEIRARIAALKSLGEKAPNTFGIIQEQHPAFTMEDRFLVKNFGTSQEKALEFIKKRHPDMDVRLSNGQIVGKAKGEPQFRVLDPDTGFFSDPVEFMKDVSDVAYDIPAGIASGAMTAIGGVGGALAGPGGALLGAGAMGGATSAAAETVRQYIGKQAGVTDEFDGGQILTSGILGAASPALFGTGATAGQIAKAAAAEVGEQTAKQAGMEASMRAAQQGLIGRLGRGLAETAGSYSSGVSKRAIQQYKKDPGVTDVLDEMGVDEFAENWWKQSDDAIKNSRRAIYSGVTEELDASGAMADIGPVVGKYFESMDKLKDKFNKFPSTSTFDELVQTGEELIELFPQISDSNIDELKEAFKLIDSIELSEENLAKGLGRGFEKSSMKVEALMSAINDFRKMPAEGAAKLTRIPVGAANDIRLSLQEIGKLHKKGDKMIDSSLQGKPVRTRREILNARESYSLMDKAIDDAASGFRNIQENYALAKGDEKFVNKYFGEPEKAIKTLRNLHKPSNKFVMDRAARIDEKYGTNILETAQLIETHTTLKHGGWVPLSAEGGTSTSRTIGAGAVLGALGATMGPAVGLSPWVGGAAGMATGSTLSSPAMMRKYIGVGRGARELGRQYRDLGGKRIADFLVPGASTPQALIKAANVPGKVYGEE
jgi:hypothetical protein